MKIAVLYPYWVRHYDNNLYKSYVKLLPVLGQILYCISVKYTLYPMPVASLHCTAPLIYGGTAGGQRLVHLGTLQSTVK